MANLESISRDNASKFNSNPDNGFVVRSGFWNNLIALLKTVLTEAGAFTVDTISEKTTDAGVTIDGVKLKDGGATVITGGTNTFNITNGTASLDVIAGAAVDINDDFAVTAGFGVTLAAEDAASSITLDEQTFEVEGEGTASRLMKLKNDTDAAVTLTMGGDQDISTDSATFTISGLVADTVSEKTPGSGVTIDSLLIKDGKKGATTAITANSTGGGAAIISAVEQHVVITFTNADHIVSLPLLSSFATGGMISGTPLNTGGELRVHPTDQTGTKYINGVTGGNELQLSDATASYFEAVKVSNTKWVVKTWSSLGAPTTIVPDL